MLCPHERPRAGAAAMERGHGGAGGLGELLLLKRSVPC